jgi:two-component system chemotaxis response regulator CheB
MPELDGLGTLAELRKSYAKLPVIMFSTLCARGAVATIDALARGASDYVTKPANVGCIAAGAANVREQLIPKIKAICRRDTRPDGLEAPRKAISVFKPAVRPLTPQRINAVVIGSSTGGPQALASVLSKLPENFPVPVVVVQHMPPIFTKHLAARLNQQCRLSVAESAGDEILSAGTALIAPGDYHLELVRVGTEVRTSLHQGPPENSCRPAVDVLFRSAATAYGTGCLAVILTGMGHDGTRGGEHIVRGGGLLIAQDEATSVVWGMPRSAFEAGLASCVLPLEAIADEITKRVPLGNRVFANTSRT